MNEGINLVDSIIVLSRVLFFTNYDRWGKGKDIAKKFLSGFRLSGVKVSLKAAVKNITLRHHCQSKADSALIFKTITGYKIADMSLFCSILQSL